MDSTLNFSVTYVDPADGGNTIKEFPNQSQAQCLKLCDTYLGNTKLKVLRVQILTRTGLQSMQQANLARQQQARIPATAAAAALSNKKK